MVPISLLMFFLVKLPLWFAMFTFMPLYCLLLTAFINLAGLHEFLKAHKRKWSWREAFVMMLAFFPYQWMLSIGAIRAVFRHIQGTVNWEKTSHTGQHRTSAA